MDKDKMIPTKCTSFRRDLEIIDDGDGSSPTVAEPTAVDKPKLPDLPKPPSDLPKIPVEHTKTDSPKVNVDDSPNVVVKTETDLDKTEDVGETPRDDINYYTLETACEEIDKFMSNFKEDGHDKSTSLEIPVFIWKFLDLFEERVVKYDSPTEVGRWGQVQEEDTSFLEALNRVSNLRISLGGLKTELDQTHGVLINRIDGVQQRAMSFIEDEFRSILEEHHPHSKSHHHHHSDSKGKQESSSNTVAAESDQSAQDQTNFPGYSEEIVTILNKMAKQMITGGYEAECCQIYIFARRNAFDESLSKIGFEKMSIDDVQKMNWETLEREIATWIKIFRECATVYFTGERQLAEAVFTNYETTVANVFSSLVSIMMIQFLNFAEAVAMTKRSVEKLFKVLDLYETLRDNLVGSENLFTDEFGKEIKTEATATKGHVGEAAICMFCDLENSIKSETGKTPVPGGAVHPLTRYTMNYLKYACEYKDTLEQVFKEHSKIERADSTSRPRFQGETTETYHDRNDAENDQSPFSKQLMKVMDLLDVNLDAKSKLYRDTALSCIFMMNNGRYILQKIKGSSEIHSVMDTWTRRKSSDLRNYHKTYQRETWGRLLGCLNLDGLMHNGPNGKVHKPALKEKFKSFNSTFDDIHKTQSSWVVSDDQLQSELRVSISAVVIPAYRSFLGRFSQYLDPGRQTEKYIKFQPEDIETHIEELFDGKRKP